MLGNSRFLIIVISVLSAVALICVGASAGDLSREDMEQIVAREEAVRNSPVPSQIPSSLFRPLTYLATASGDNSSRGNALAGVYGPSNPIEVTYFSVQCQNLSSVWQSPITMSFDEPVELYFDNTNSWFNIYVNGERITDERSFVSAGRVRATLYNSEVDLTTDDPSVFVVSVSPPLLDIGSFFNSILSVGNKIVSFVLSSWVVLVPVVAFVCFLGFGVIRRLVKGV